MPLFQGFRPVAGTICPSRAAAVVGPSRAPQGMKKGRRPRRRPRLKLSDKAGPDQCPVPGENALFPAQIAGFLAVSRPVPVYPVFLNYVVPVQSALNSPQKSPAVAGLFRQTGALIFTSAPFVPVSMRFFDFVPCSLPLKTLILLTFSCFLIRRRGSGLVFLLCLPDGDNLIAPHLPQAVF